MSQTTSQHFSLYQGTVVSCRKWSDTHVWSSGGGGYVDPKFGGYVAAAQVDSKVIQKVEVFIKDRLGLQHALELTDIGVPLTEGNQIIAIMDERWEGKPIPIYFENLDTRMVEMPSVSTGKPQGNPFDGLGKGLLWGLIGCMSSLVFGANFFWNAGWFVFCLVGIPTWWVSNVTKTSKNLIEFKTSNSAFLMQVKDAAKQNGINFSLKDPEFGPLIRIA